MPRSKEALSLLNEALDGRRAVFGDESWKTAEARLYLAQAMSADGRAADAIRAARAS